MRVLPESSLSKRSQEEKSSILIEVRLESKLVWRFGNNVFHLVFVRLLRWVHPSSSNDRVFVRGSNSLVHLVETVLVLVTHASGSDSWLLGIGLDLLSLLDQWLSVRISGFDVDHVVLWVKRLHCSLFSFCLSSISFDLRSLLVHLDCKTLNYEVLGLSWKSLIACQGKQDLLRQEGVSDGLVKLGLLGFRQFFQRKSLLNTLVNELDLAGKDLIRLLEWLHSCEPFLLLGIKISFGLVGSCLFIFLLLFVSFKLLFI